MIPAKPILLFPGRHLTHTKFQVGKLLSLPEPTHIIFAISSANQEDCRYNPIPYAFRAIGCDQFGSLLQAAGHQSSLVGIPHYKNLSPTDFCRRTISHCSDELGIEIAPDNTTVLISTPGLMEAWQSLGFSIDRAEAEHTIARPTSIIHGIGSHPHINPWTRRPRTSELATFSKLLFERHPYLIHRIETLWNTPLISEQGHITDSRNYRTYEADMASNAFRKFQQLRPHILPGRICDEGCADGTLLEVMAPYFPDSDLLGIDISSEFAARFREKQRQGAFGQSYAQFFHRNLLEPIFKPNSISTTLCNSTLHEIYSYNGGEPAITNYLRLKFAQLCPGGRLVARDIVGPPAGASSFWTKGEIRVSKPSPIAEQSISERFETYITTSPWETQSRVGYQGTQDGWTQWTAPNRTIMEFVHRMHYTENWEAELRESFCFWDHSQWLNALMSAGFYPLKESYTVCEDWLVENRFNDFVRFTPEFYLVTHHILVAEKPG